MAVEKNTNTASPKETAAPAKATETKTASKAETTARTPPPIAKTETKPKAAVQDKAGENPKATAQDKASPSFDVVRVEPDGSAVIAGRARPGWKVVVRSKGVVIGKAIANARGEWVIISDKPISAGSSNLKLTASSPDNTMTLASSQIVAISRPAATLKTPGKMAAAEISKTKDMAKTGPDAPAAPGTEIKTAMNDQAAKATTKPKPDMTGGSDTAEAKRPVETKTQMPKAQDAAKAPVNASDGKTEKVETAPLKDAQPAKTGSETSVADARPAILAKTENMGEAKSAPQATDSHAPARPAEKVLDTDAGKVIKLAEATEKRPEITAPGKAESEKTVPGKTAAMAVAKKPGIGIAEKKPLKTGTSATAEVKTTAEKPAPETMPEPVEKKPAQPAKPLIVVSEPGKASRVLQTPAQEPAENTMPLTFRSVDYDDKGQVILSGKAKPDALVRVYLNNDFIGSATSNSEGVWELKTRTNVMPGKYTLRVDQIGHGNRIAARVEAPFKRAAPEAVKQARINGEVVIQPGDNLWNISRALYGHGVQYTIIYKANRNKIKDPDLIYPGQIFSTPGSGPAAVGK
jgi:nucleoid-associated protein YgaU